MAWGTEAEGDERSAEGHEAWRATPRCSGRFGWLPLMMGGVGLMAALLSLTAAGQPTALAVQPGVNCSSYTGPGGVCVIDVGDTWFCNDSYQGGVCPTSIVAGDTVRWEYPSSGQLFHTTTECGADCDAPTSKPLWDSGRLQPGDSFEVVLSVPGQYLYYCAIHPIAQRGLIRVLEPDTTPLPTAAATATPGATGTALPAATTQPPATSTSAASALAQSTPAAAALPATGSPGEGADGGWSTIAGLLLGVGGLFLLGGALLRGRPGSLNR